MSLSPCPDCGTEISQSADACPKCGRRAPRSFTWAWVVFGLAAAFLGFGAIQPYTLNGREMAKDRAELKACWENTRDKREQANQNNPTTCKALEDWFVRKHGKRP